MTGEDIFRALSEIDDELLVLPSRAALRVQKGKKRKILTVLLIAAIAMLVLCGFGYASRLDMTYEDGVLEISVYNPNVVEEYEQWSMGYIAEGYEITQVSNIMWLVSNGNQGFYLMQMKLIEGNGGTVVVTFDEAEWKQEIEVLENLIPVTEDYIQETRTFCWASDESMFAIFIVGQIKDKTKEKVELVAMIQSITS